ncbi:MAG: tetratricopeptide repeat protein [Candidatus Thiothrix putei]|uniref:Tetratricopeptide repeat protein n=1 Tax=Candidatus Thiothrix putei TaxID=3080811 RepID=A0AA95HAY0_9GAMM|nr:MAG: tetratricopeptide repeat protein [Candidatus Thiothrix putei]
MQKFFGKTTPYKSIGYDCKVPSNLCLSTYSGQEKHEKAIDIAQLAVSLSATPYRAFYIMAESYRRMEKYDNAIEQHKKSLELAKRAPTQNSLAYCYYKKKNFITAEAEFRKSLEISRNPTAVIGVAKSLLMQDNYEKACEYCHEGVVLTKEEIERGTTLVWSYYNIATAYLILNKKEKCIEAINKSIFITSKNRAQIREQVYDYELMANNENINQDLAKECIDLWKIAI